MRIRVAFTLNVRIEGEHPSHDDLVEAITDWLESEGGDFGNTLIDFISEDYAIDSLVTDVNMIRVGSS